MCLFWIRTVTIRTGSSDTSRKKGKLDKKKGLAPQNTNLQQFNRIRFSYAKLKTFKALHCRKVNSFENFLCTERHIV